MTDWKSIEEFDKPDPIWVIKYDMYSDAAGNHCEANGRAYDYTDNGKEGIKKFTDCHGWYKTFEDANRVWKHFKDPYLYHIEKVYFHYTKELAFDLLKQDENV